MYVFRIMPPRRFKKKSIRKIVERRVAKAMEKYEKTRVDSNNTNGSGSTNTGGTVVPKMQGCSYKTFMNGKPHSFKGTEGVVELKRWFEKMEQVFEICKCAEDGKVMFAMCTFEGRALTWWNGNVQTLGLVNANSDPVEQKGNQHCTVNWFEQSVQARAGKNWERHKRKWEDTRVRMSVAYAATVPAGGKIYAGNLPQNATGANLHHNGSLSSKKCACFGVVRKDISTDKYPKAGKHRIMEAPSVGGRAYVVVMNSINRIKCGHGSFDVIIGMDWLAYHRALIDCYETVVHILLQNGKILEVQGDMRPEKVLRYLHVSRLMNEKSLMTYAVVRDLP
ncbi:hypothetical protein Tco_0064065 [Tanacetum coccineum]